MALGIADFLAYSEAKDDATCVSILDYLMSKHGIVPPTSRFIRTVTIPAANVSGTGIHEEFPLVIKDVGLLQQVRENAGYQYRNLVMTDDSFNEVPTDVVGRDHDMGEGGQWCWFQRARAIHSAAQEKTWYAHHFYRWQAITELDQTTGLTKTVRMNEHPDLYNAVADDHNNGTLIIRKSNQKLLTFYTNHNQVDAGEVPDSTIWYRQSTYAINDGVNWDINAWDAEAAVRPSTPLYYTYCDVYQFDDAPSDDIYCFYRTAGGAPDGSNAWGFCTSADSDPLDFDNYTNVYDGEDVPGGAEADWKNIPYCIFKKKDEGRLDVLVVTSHPEQRNSLYNKVGHFYIDMTQKPPVPYKHAAGGDTALTFPVMAEDLTYIEHPGGQTRHWNSDVTWDGDNAIVSFYSMDNQEGSYEFPGNGSYSGPHRNHNLWVSRWTGTTWDTEFVVNTGDGFDVSSIINMSYCGDMTFDPKDKDRLVVSANLSGQHPAVGQNVLYDLYEFKRIDGTWTNVGQITKGGEPAGQLSYLQYPQHYPTDPTANSAVRPFFVPNYEDGQFGILSWMSLGSYANGYNRAQSSIRFWPFNFDVYCKVNVSADFDNSYHLLYDTNAEYVNRDHAAIYNDNYKYVCMPHRFLDNRPIQPVDLKNRDKLMRYVNRPDPKLHSNYGALSIIDNFPLHFYFTDLPNFRNWQEMTVEFVAYIPDLTAWSQADVGNWADLTPSFLYRMQTNGTIRGFFRRADGAADSIDPTVNAVITEGVAQHHAMTRKHNEMKIDIEGNIDVKSLTDGVMPDTDSSTLISCFGEFQGQGAAAHYVGFILISDVVRDDGWRATFRDQYGNPTFATISDEFEV